MDGHKERQTTLGLAELEMERFVDLKSRFEKKLAVPLQKKQFFRKMCDVFEKRLELLEEGKSGHLGIRPHDLLSGLQTASNAFSGCLA